jgi:cell division septation protein DedD
MNAKTISVILVSLLFLMYFSACDSSSYEMEEVDIPKDTSRITRYNEIKQEVEKPKPEIKEETKKEEPTIVSNQPEVKYTIQIGAYEHESNAQDMLNKAKSYFSSDAYYDLKGDLYKVRIGKLSSTDEALTMLSKIQGAGFYDAFITRVDK